VKENGRALFNDRDPGSSDNPRSIRSERRKEDIKPKRTVFTGSARGRYQGSGTLRFYISFQLPREKASGSRPGKHGLEEGTGVREGRK